MCPYKPFIQFSKLTLALNRKLILWLAGGLALLFILIAYSGPGDSFFYWIGLFMGGALISSGGFKELHDAGSGISYLTLPCTALTRFLSIWVLTGPVYYLFITSLYGIGILGHILFKKFFGFGDPFTVLWMGAEYLVINAFFLLGGIIFKKLPVLKSACCLLVISSMIGGSILSAQHFWSPLEANILKYSLCSLLGIITWLASYFQLKRVELK